MKTSSLILIFLLFLTSLAAQHPSQDSLLGDLEFRVSLMERSASLKKEARILELTRFQMDLKTMVDDTESRLDRNSILEVILGFLGFSTIGAFFLAFLKFKRKMIWEFVPDQAQKIEADTLKALRKEIRKKSKEIAEDLLDENFESWYDLILRYEAEVAIKGQKKILVLSPKGDPEIVTDIKQYLQIEWGFEQVEFDEIAGAKDEPGKWEAQDEKIKDFDLVIFNNPKDQGDNTARMGQLLSKNKDSKPVFLYYGRFLDALRTSKTISTASNFRSTLIFRILELFRMQKMREIASQKSKPTEE